MDVRPTNSKKESQANDFAIGSIAFEKYEILDFINAGGAGRVYKARDLTLHNVIALKVLINDSKNERAMIRFQSEARTSSKLNHPNIATIFDFGVQGNTPYLIMEFVEGESLQQMLVRENELDMPDFLDIFIQVCAALIYAHKQGIVHRDIKPGNIVIHRNNHGNVTAKILDFGVAKRVDTIAGEDGKLTPTGDLVGSPLYMSPEQCQGISVTEKADVYSLGCVMWQCLAGRPPFQSDTAMETILQHINQVPEELIDVRPDKEEIPETLSKLIDSMLSKNPADRADLKGSVLPALINLRDHVVEEQVQEAAPAIKPDTIFDTTLVFQSTTEKKNRNLARNLALVVLIVVVGSIVAFTVSVAFNNEMKDVKLRYSDSPPLVVETGHEQDFRNSRKQTIQAARPGKLLDLTHVYSDRDLATVTDSSRITMVNFTGSYITNHGLSLLSQWPLTYLDLTRTHIDSIDELAPLKNRLRHLDLKGTPVGNDDIKKLIGFDALQYLCVSQTRITDAALEDLAGLKALKNLDLSETQIDGSGLQFLSGAKNLTTIDLSDTSIPADKVATLAANAPALNEIKLGRNTAISDRARQILRHSFPCISFSPTSSLLVSEEGQATAAAQLGDFSSELEHYEKALQYLEQQYGKECSRSTTLYAVLARTAAAMQNIDLCEKYQKICLRLARKYDQKSEIVQGLELSATVAGKHGNWKQADEEWSEALKAADKLYGPNSEQVEQLCLRYGNAYLTAKDWPRVLSAYQRSADIRRKIAGESAHTAFSILLVGEIYRAMGKDQQALRAYDEGLAMYENSKTEPLADETDRALNAYNHAAQISYKDNRLEAAKTYNDRGWKLSLAGHRRRMAQEFFNQRIAILSGLKSEEEIEKTRSEYERLMQKRE